MANYMWPLLGGVLIGLSASFFLLLYGRSAGVSGMVAAVLPGSNPGGETSAITEGRSGSALFFLAGLLVAGAVMRLVWPAAFGSTAASAGLVAASGLLVGFGTRLGGGCTSGHGVAGISRFSKRSIVATMTFMATAIVTVFVMRQLGAG